MIEIIEVKTKKQQKLFVDFPIKLYRDCNYFVPTLKIAEYNIFKESKQNTDVASVFYLAKLNGQIVGRIGGIIHSIYNEKTDQKRVRFTRFDCVNNFQVANALISAVENWAIRRGMQCTHGPMGFNDLEKVGVQSNNFEQMGNLVALYNFPYYKKLLEKCGYLVETKFTEYRIATPKNFKYVFELDNYKVVKTKNVYKLLNKYKTKVFDLINECYAPLYGAIPITPKLKEVLVEQYSFLINHNFIALIVDENNSVVGFGLAIPGLAFEMNLNKGKLINFDSFKLLKAFRKPNYAELMFLCVSPSCDKPKVAQLIKSKLIYGMNKCNIPFVESNPILDDGILKTKYMQDLNTVKRKEREVYYKILKNN